MIRKIKLFFTFDKNMKQLLAESFFYLGWARYRKSLSFSKIAPSLGQAMSETTFDTSVERNKQLAAVSQAIDIMSRYTLWESQCLVKAMAAMKMLEKRNIESTLYLGTAKEEKAGLVAHAWLRSGSYYVSGKEEMHRFTVVAQFAKEISPKTPEGETYE